MMYGLTNIPIPRHPYQRSIPSTYSTPIHPRHPPKTPTSPRYDTDTIPMPHVGFIQTPNFQPAGGVPSRSLGLREIEVFLPATTPARGLLVRIGLGLIVMLR